MKKLLMAATAAAVLMAGTPAFAASTDSDTFDINASVAKTCTMENIGDIQLGTVNVNTNAGSSALFINDVASNSTNSFYVSCNDTNSMTISSANAGRLTTSTPLTGADAGFKNTINYSLAADNYRNGGLLQQPGFRRSALLGLIQLNNGASRGALHRQVKFDALVDPLNNLDARPVAGTYSDTVTVTVTAS
ncbi:MULTISPECIES: spore coat protein U domain-containing protein [Sphingobium]|uniref:spore coat protein U domain-containing protein n=1 Tax=Sphingobium TaxID=165695 RepID=UPI00159C4DC2|nr:spore coat protein U domain-containing protein [Sphingobium sp. 15-1]